VFHSSKKIVWQWGVVFGTLDQNLRPIGPRAGLGFLAMGAVSPLPTRYGVGECCKIPSVVRAAKAFEHYYYYCSGNTYKCMVYYQHITEADPHVKF